MSIVRITVFTVISSLVLLKKVQSDVAHDFTLKEYNGLWYQLALLVHHDNKTQKIPSEWFNVTKSHLCPGCFKEVYLPSRSFSSSKTGFGSISTSNHVRVSYPSLRKPRIYYEIIKCANGEELIFYDSRNLRNTKLVGRNQTASTETKIKFEDIAITNGLYAVYADPKDYST